MSPTVPFLAVLIMATTAMAAEIPSHDRKFATAAAEAGTAEVAEARLALKNSQRSDVREFAQHMIADHSEANAKLADIAKQLGVKLPEGLDADDQRKVDTLSGLTGDAFDLAYVKDQVAAHKSAVSFFTSEANLGEEKHLKTFASATLPVLKSHQEMIKAIAEH